MLVRSVVLRQLRNTRQLKAWLQAGETVELRERNRIIGRIVPVRSSVGSREWPDFVARAKRIFEKRVLPGADLLVEERGRY